MDIEERNKRELFLNGVKAFNKKKYYDAHEYWEELWIDYQLDDAKFIQGLIQMSVGYFHITNLNIIGAKRLFEKCLPKLKYYEKGVKNINVQYLIESVDKSLNNLNSIRHTKDFDWRLAPKI